MSLTSEIAALRGWINEMPRLAAGWLGAGRPIYVLDFLMLAAAKRSLSLAGGLDAMVTASNMVCARAILRMHLDTVTRIRAYSYVDDPHAMAQAVLGGTKLDRFKSRDGNRLRDAYLIDRFNQEYPWAAEVYKRTSGYVHFSESQFFDTVQSVGSDDDRSFRVHISREDTKYPEASWEEVVACFNEVTVVLAGSLEGYFRQIDA